MRLLALDIGDRWTGTAISDELGIFARPYKTIKTHLIKEFLQTLISQENIQTIVAGLPKTMRGKESQQTKKTKEFVQKLKHFIPTTDWILWDERLTSKQARSIHQSRKKNKQDIHSIAAALILGSYLDHLYLQKTHHT